MTGLLSLLLMVAPLVPGEDKPAAPAIRGKWEVTSTTFNGTAFKQPKGRFLIFGEGYLGSIVDTAPSFQFRYKLDTTADPKRIDVEDADRPTADRRAVGIYAIDKDEMRLCYAEPGGARPVKFESKPGDRVFLLVLKRVKE